MSYKTRFIFFKNEKKPHRTTCVASKMKNSEGKKRSEGLADIHIRDDIDGD